MDLDNLKLSKTAIVIIGRNEGERLHRCIESMPKTFYNIVYVDSGSSDGSVKLAKKYKIHVIELDLSTPLSAARARNEGFKHLLRMNPSTKYVQFVDGDCELNNNWVETASQFLEDNSHCAVVCGRLRERHPEASIYNRLCDIEWNGPPGEINACGGIFMVRSDIYQEINGMNQLIIAGEEPEMCFRLRKKGWKIYRIPHDMALHDAAIMNFRQWWLRAMRSGFAYAIRYDMHRKNAQGYCRRESLRIWFWAIIPILSAIFLSYIFSPLFFLLLLIYFIQFLRISISANKRLKNIIYSVLYGFFTILDKWPQCIGQLLYIKQILMRNCRTIIEHK